MNHTIYLSSDEWALVAVAGLMATTFVGWVILVTMMIREHLHNRRICQNCKRLNRRVESRLWTCEMSDGSTHLHCPVCGWRSRG